MYNLNTYLVLVYITNKLLTIFLLFTFLCNLYLLLYVVSALINKLLSIDFSM